MKLTISIGQMDVKLGSPQANLQAVKTMAAEASRRGSDIVVFPELWSTGYDLENGAEYATTTSAGIFASISQLAQAQHISILGSCLSDLGEGQIGNTAVYVNKNGQNLGEYSKTHLFRLMDEDQFLTAGQQITMVESEWGLMGLTICYDLRFPELFRTYALAGAQLVFVPSEWPYPRLKHWQTLLRARAIENQMFIVACNRVGTSKNTDFCGHSAIIDPWGETIIEGGEQEMLLTATIDLDQVHEVRAKIPIFKDRRPDVYG
jgi:predicted amidohydrolase